MWETVSDFEDFILFEKYLHVNATFTMNEKIYILLKFLVIK